MVSRMNSGIATGGLAFLMIIVLFLLAYALYLYRLVLSYEGSVGVNPYCFRQLCTDDGSQKSSYEIPPSDDPTRSMYQTLNYCMVNAPPCEFITAVKACADPGSEAAGTTGTSVTVDELETTLEFYNQHYWPRCKYSYNGPTVATSEAGKSSGVNAPPLLDGPNDTFLTSLLSCAKIKGLDTNTNWIALNNIVCGKDKQCIMTSTTESERFIASGL